ncbi:MAG: PAS domain-containing protein [Planctomycetota bacterium]
MRPSQRGAQTKRLRRTYVAALSALALLAVLAPVAVQVVIRDSAQDAISINTAGLQRMLSQRVASQALLLADQIDSRAADRSVPQNTGADQAANPAAAARLRGTLDRLLSSHDELVRGAAGQDHLRSIHASLVELEPRIARIAALSAELLEIASSPSRDRARATVLADTIAAEAEVFLPRMHEIVGQYEHVSIAHIIDVRRVSIFLALLATLVLALEALFVFEPALRMIRRQEDEAADRTSHYEHIAEVAQRTDNVVVITDARRRIVWVNDAFVRQTGYTLTEVKGRGPGSVLHSANTDPRTTQRMREALDRGGSFKGQILNRAKNGREYWIEVDIQPKHDAQGELTGFVAVESDITEMVRARKQAEATLREMSALRAALDEHALLSIADAKGRIIDANTGFQRISGYSRDELIGKDHDVLNSGHHPKSFWRDVWRQIATGHAWRGEVCNRRKDGSLYWVDSTIVPHHDADGRIEKYVSIRFDISESKQAEHDLREAKALLDQTGRIAGIGGWSLELDSLTPVWSPEIYRIHEVNPDYQPDLEHALDFYPGEARDTVRKAVDVAIADNKPWDLEVPFVTAKGNHRWVRTIGQPEFNKGVCTRLWGAFQDVTDRVNAERELAEARARYERAIEGSSDGLWEYNPATGESWISDRGLSLLGHDADESSDLADFKPDWASIVHPNDRDAALDAAKEQLEADASFDVRCRLRTTSGEYRWFRARGRAERDERGEPVLMSGSLSDVHDQHTAETRLELAMRSANIGLWDWDMRTDQIHYSDTYYTMLGYEPGSLPMTVETWRDIAHPDDLGDAMRGISEHVAGHAPAYRNEHRVRTKDGNWRWINDIGEIVERDEQGEPTRMLGVHVDIHEQKQTAERLQLSLEATNAGTWDWDVVGQTLRVNATMNAILGMPSDNTLIDQDRLAQIIAPEHNSKIASHIEAILAGEQQVSEFEFPVLRPSGTHRWIRCIGRITEQSAQGVPLRVVGQAFDITEQHAAALEIQALQERLRLFVEHAPAAIAMFDLDMRYLVASAGWYRDYDLHDQDIIGRSHYDVFPDLPERWYDDHRRTLAGEVLSLDRDVFERDDGTETHLRWELRPWRNAEGDIGGLIMFTECIDEQIEHERRLEDAIHSAESASHAKSEFLANMSHEIRTPMSAILGYTELLETEDDLRADPARTLDALRTIRSNANHLLTIINDILDMSKIEAGRMTLERISTDPVRLVEEAASMLRVRAASKGIDLRVRYDTPVPRSISSDPTRLRQILLNLTGNAVKFTETGSVTIAVSCDADAERLHLSVIDTGIGMTPEQRDEIARFEAFAQADTSTSRKFGGSGLGLRISATLAKLLGGGIEVQSTIGIGSVFTVEVATGPLAGVAIYEPDLAPPTKAHPSNPSPEPADATTVLAGLRILLAEDGLDNQRLISFHLTKAGATVEVASNGLEALDAVCVSSGVLADPLPVDLILTDMQMPELDGYGLAARLREMGYRGPLIALTAHAMDGDRARCIDAGCDDYLTKPIDKQQLIDACARWSGRGNAHRTRPAA